MVAITEFITGRLNTAVWMYIFLPGVAAAGVLLTLRTGFIQFRHFGHIMRNTAGKLLEKKAAEEEGSVTPLQAVTTALAATLGTGNIVGTSQAIAMGGYGAVFWLWAAAVLGMAVKYAEVTLSIKFRRRDQQGDWVGGPMYYIAEGLGPRWSWLAAAFALLAMLASFGIGNMSQANSITGSVTQAAELFFRLDEAGLRLLRWGLGVFMALLAAGILMGGVRRIGRVTEILIPFMSLAYIGVCLIVLICHARNIPGVLGRILVSAFSPQAAAGAASGIAMKEALVWGLRRSAFSNEAGLGSAGIAHAAAETPSAVAQGFYGVFEVFMDTIVICTLTALTILCSGVEISYGLKPGTELVCAAFSTVFGAKFSALFIALSLTFFAFSTVLGWALYGGRCSQYLFGVKSLRVYQLVFFALIVVGCVSPVNLVWDIADTLNGLMALPNLAAVFALSGLVVRLTREYFDSAEYSLGKSTRH